MYQRPIPGDCTFLQRATQSCAALWVAEVWLNCYAVYCPVIQPPNIVGICRFRDNSGYLGILVMYLIFNDGRKPLAGRDFFRGVAQVWSCVCHALIDLFCFLCEEVHEFTVCISVCCLFAFLLCVRVIFFVVFKKNKLAPKLPKTEIKILIFFKTFIKKHKWQLSQNEHLKNIALCMIYFGLFVTQILIWMIRQASMCEDIRQILLI